MSVSLFRIAKSYYYMEDVGYYYSKEECQKYFPISRSNKCKPKNLRINYGLDSIKYLNFLLHYR